MRVIDSHFHWFTPALLDALCEQKEYPAAVHKGDGYAWVGKSGTVGKQMDPVWHDLERGLATSQEVTGNETSVVCTTGTLSSLLDQLPLDVAVPMARIYNEEMAAAHERHRDRFYGTAYVPLMDTNEAIGVLDHAVKELGLCGVNLPALTNGETIDAERLEPFYARVAELGVPLIVHPSDIAFGETFGGDYAGSLQLTIGRLVDSSVTVLRLIFSGVLDRHPDLKIIQTHAGALLPYQAGRIDKNVYKCDEITSLPLTPSEYMKQLFVDTVAPQALTIRTAIEFFGISQILYGTDYPCWSQAKAVATLDESELTVEQAESIYWRNATSTLCLPS